jgi:hypothetical protein
MEIVLKVSNSKLKTWRRCQKKFEYKYIEKLRAKVKSLPLTKGSWMHECLEAYYKGEDWTSVFKKLKKEYNDLFEEEKVMLGDLPSEVLRLMRGYLYAWKEEDAKWEVLATELEFNVPIVIDSKAQKAVLLNGYIDLIIRDSSGIWGVEHKNMKSEPSEEYRMTDVQSTLYFRIMRHLAKQGELPGVTNPDEIQGYMFNYIRTKAPTVPKLLKNGTLSRAKIDTDRVTYLTEIKRHGLNPKDYADIMRGLSSRTFYNRCRVAKPDELGSIMMNELKGTSVQILTALQYPHIISRTLERSCQWDCEYFDLCHGELRGLDTDFIKAHQFEVKEEEGRDGEEEPANDDRD